MTTGWESFHETKASTGHVLAWPDEYVVRFVSRWRRDLPEVRRVLDLQCGGGRHGVVLAGLGFDVVAADLSAKAVSLARDAFVVRGAQPLGIVRGSSPRLPFASGSFDGLVAWRSLHVFPREVLPTVFSELGRVVRPGMPVLFSTRSDRNIYAGHVGTRGLPPPTDLTLSQLEELCGGLDVTEIELSEATAQNRSLRDSYWVVHARAR